MTPAEIVAHEQVCLDAYDDDLPRAVYADRLEENSTSDGWSMCGCGNNTGSVDLMLLFSPGGSVEHCAKCDGSGRINHVGNRFDERAEFIRVQIELDRIETPVFRKITGEDPSTIPDPLVQRHAYLKSRERELFVNRDNYLDWLGVKWPVHMVAQRDINRPLPGSAGATVVMHIGYGSTDTEVRFRRGFPWKVVGRVEDWIGRLCVGCLVSGMFGHVNRHGDNGPGYYPCSNCYGCGFEASVGISLLRGCRWLREFEAIDVRPYIEPKRPSDPDPQDVRPEPDEGFTWFDSESETSAREWNEEQQVYETPDGMLQTSIFRAMEKLYPGHVRTMGDSAIPMICFTTRAFALRALSRSIFAWALAMVELRHENGER